MKVRWFVIPLLALVCAPLAAQTVWTGTDGFYHKDRNCSKLHGATHHKDTKAHAEDQGKKPCRACYS